MTVRLIGPSILCSAALLTASGCGESAEGDPGRSRPLAAAWYGPAVGSGNRVRLLWASVPGARAIRVSQRDLKTGRALTIYATRPQTAELAIVMRCVDVRVLGRRDARPLRSGIHPAPLVEGENGARSMGEAILKSARRKLTSMRCKKVQTVKARGRNP